MKRLTVSEPRAKKGNSAPGIPWPLVQVEWLDSRQPASAWQWADQCCSPEIVRCLSVGFLVGDTKEALAIAPNLGDVRQERIQASGIINIPRKTVVSVNRLSRC
jgi:hypothetical protein